MSPSIVLGERNWRFCVFVLKELPCCLLELSLSTDLARSYRRIFTLEGEKNDTLIFRILTVVYTVFLFIFSFLMAVSYLKNRIYPTIKWVNLQILLLVHSLLYKFFHLVDFVCSADSVIWFIIWSAWRLTWFKLYFGSRLYFHNNKLCCCYVYVMIE